MPIDKKRQPGAKNGFEVGRYAGASRGTPRLVQGPIGTGPPAIAQGMRCDAGPPITLPSCPGGCQVSDALLGLDLIGFHAHPGRQPS